MYWIFLVLFIIAILIPDIIRGPVYFLTEERAEEVAIFFMGVVAFLVFMRNEYMFSVQKKEKEKDRKKMKQTVKDLVESYSYIGEVNRKMDILMSIALGLSDRSVLNKNREKEIYEAIVSASNFLMKADRSFLRFIKQKETKNIKEIKLDHKKNNVKNEDLVSMGKDISFKKNKDYLVVCSNQKINDIKSSLVICGYDDEEEKNPKNIEILKVFASQALFLYSYLALENGDKQ